MDSIEVCRARFNPDNALLLVADNWPLLRRCDVFRLLDENCGYRDLMAAAIDAARPDLKAATNAAMLELGEFVPWPGRGDY